MTVESTSDDTADSRLFAEIAGILRKLTAESAEWATRLTPNDRLEGDLGLESVEFVELGEMLAQRYGGSVDLPALLAGLDLDEIIGFTVGDLIGYLATHRAERGAPGVPA
jgi:acyl carrier protein